MRVGLLILSALLLFCFSAASARTWYVKPDSTGDVATIRVAVDSAAAQGDTVLLADGTFTGEGNYEVDCLDKAVTIVSESGNPELCIVDCGCPSGCFERRVGFYFRASAHGAPRLEGITISHACGGVVCDTSSCPEIAGCVFSDNRCLGAEIGPGAAGMDCRANSEPMIVDCTFLSNTAAGGGGGIGCNNSSPTLINVSFLGNWGPSGGGVCSWGGAPQFTDCLFDGNWSGAPMSGLGGGGLCCSGSPSLVNCTFSGNSCDNGDGGGLCFTPDSDSDHLSLVGCSFISNWVQGTCGAGMLAWDLWGHDPSFTIRNCTFYGNGGYPPTLYEGGALCIIGNSSATLENTIIAFNRDGEAVLCQGPAPPTLTCCNIYGNPGGDWVGCIEGQAGTSGNISADPLFCDTLSGDFSVENCSPCLPGNHPDGYDCGGFIGASDSGCECRTAAKPTSWGAIKAIYR
jgi:hypothetical protein